MSENPIAARSKSRLASALGELLLEKRFDAITITELCARAHLSRPAFYQNFTSIREVAARYLQAALNEAMANRQDSRIDNPRAYGRACLDIYESAQPTIELFVRNGLEDVVIAECLEAFLALAPKPVEYRSLFAAAGIANVLAREDGEFDRDEMHEVLDLLLK